MDGLKFELKNERVCTIGAGIGLVEVSSRLRVDRSGFNEPLPFQVGNVAGYFMRRESALGQFILLGYGCSNISWLYLILGVELTDSVGKDRREGLVVVGGHRHTISSAY